MHRRTAPGRDREIPGTGLERASAYVSLVASSKAPTGYKTVLGPVGAGSTWLLELRQLAAGSPQFVPPREPVEAWTRCRAATPDTRVG
ncbi:hypothetical protein [Streptomyces phaeochromogenes]